MPLNEELFACFFFNLWYPSLRRCSKWCMVKLNGMSAVTQAGCEWLNGRHRGDISCRSFVHITSSLRQRKTTSYFMLLRLTALSFCCSLVNGVIFLLAEQKWKLTMWKRNQKKKRVSSVYTPFWSRTVVCMIVGMCGCTVLHTLSFDFVD